MHTLTQSHNPIKQKDIPNALTSIEIILEGAEKQIKKYGYKNITITKIAQTIHFSPSTIYKYFHNKDVLIEALYERTIMLAYRELRQSLYEDILTKENSKNYRDVTYHSSISLFKIYEKYRDILINLPEQSKEIEKISHNLSLEKLMYATEISFLQHREVSATEADIELMLFLINNFSYGAAKYYISNHPENVSEKKLQREIINCIACYFKAKKVIK